MEGEPIMLYEAQVVSVDDTYGGRRIKARVNGERCSDDELPWAFPLMPKTINVMPKVGELVLILPARSNEPDSNRFYIGPIISQYQLMNNDQFNFGNGQSDMLFSDRTSDGCLENIDNYEITNGAFPKVGSVGLIGRDAEDITLNEGNVIIRSGARKDVSDEESALTGKVGFDNKDTAFIKLEKNENGIGVTHEKDTDIAKSACIVDADKIYLVSRHENNVDSAIDEYDPEEMISDEKLQELQDAMHEVPYGDKLVSFLNNMKKALVNHTHPWADKPPYNAYGIEQVVADDYNDILSPNVFTS